MNQADPWDFLKRNTPARIAQGRSGHSLPTRVLLDFQLDHARARDAVQAQLPTHALNDQLQAIIPNPLLLHSQAPDRRTYLLRPDLGRRLDESSREKLQAPANNQPESKADLCIVIADGLSATAIMHHAVPVVTKLVNELTKIGWCLAPICIVEQGRVAIGDEIADGLGAEIVVILLGERPGLSSPDSLGAYLTYRPRPGLTDESRNCVSNIRPEGFPYDLAVQKLVYLLTEMKRYRLSGVGLKDEMPIHTLPHTSFPEANEQIPEIPD
jgi:ethanolamine ammonia-lyase small subunit